MITTSTPSSLEQVSQAAARAGHWLSAANTAANVLQDESWRKTHPSAGDWITDAAQRAGYSVNAFRRQVRVTKFLKSKVDEKEWPTLIQRSVPFANLELLQRLFDANPEQAEELLPMVISGSVSFRAMRDLYQKSQKAAGDGSGKTLFANRAQQFLQRAVDCIRVHQEEFVGAVDTGTTIQFHTGFRGFPYARPDLLIFAIQKNSANPSTPIFIDAFEMKLFGMDDSRQVLARTLEQVALMEGFFRQVWLIYPSSNPPVESHERYVKELSIHLSALRMQSVGVALVPETFDPTSPQTEAPVIRRLPSANANPRHAGLLATYLNNHS